MLRAFDHVNGIQEGLTVAMLKLEQQVRLDYFSNSKWQDR
jgi:hypothetical protein